MKNKTYLGLILLAISILVSCTQITSNTSEKLQTYTYLDGIKITPLKVKENETEHILGIEKWKFNVVPPKSHEIISYKLELRQKGKKTTTFFNGGHIISNDTLKPMEIVVAFYPVDGSTLTSNKLRYYISTDTGSNWGLVDNPLKGLGLSSQKASPTPLRGGSRAFILRQYQTVTTLASSDPNNLMLVFTIETK